MKGKNKETKTTSKKVSSKELDKLRDELAKRDEELKESQDKFTRLFAEFDNYKKRTARERLDLISTASVDVLSSLIPVVDDFERAINATKDAEETEGISLVYNKFLSILKNKGLEPTATEAGDDFDVDFHEAITAIPAKSEEEKGKVVDVIEKGYKLGDKVIRYAKVVIGE